MEHRLTKRSLLITAGGVTSTLAACGRAQPGTTPAPGADPQSLGARERAAALNTIPGHLLYVGDANVYVWEKGTARRLTSDRISRQPSWSPDGKRIALVKIDVSSSELWVMDADSSNSRQLTHNYDPVLTRNNWAWRPVWWPDASRLLYLSEEGTNDLMVWQIGLDGKNRRPFLTVPDGDGGLDMASVSPDGKRLALISYRGPGLRSQVWTYGLPSGPWRQLTETAEGAYDPAWSPDGTHIAFTVRNKGKHDLWVMQADGSASRQLTESGACRAPCWSPDGQWLAYVSGQDGGFDVWAMPAPTGQTVSGTATAAPVAERNTAVRLTRGAQVDTVSGLSWTK